MEILDIKIERPNIDLSDKVYYSAVILKNKKKFRCQMITDGIFNEHMDLKQWVDKIETEFKKK